VGFCLRLDKLPFHVGCKYLIPDNFQQNNSSSGLFFTLFSQPLFLDSGPKQLVCPPRSDKYLTPVFPRKVHAGSNPYRQSTMVDGKQAAGSSGKEVQTLRRLSICPLAIHMFRQLRRAHISWGDHKA